MKAVKKYKLSGTRWIGKNDSTYYLRFLQLYCIAETGTTIVQKKNFFFWVFQRSGEKKRKPEIDIDKKEMQLTTRNKDRRTGQYIDKHALELCKQV